MELKCAVQKYAWGKVGKSSLVAQLSESNSGSIVDEKECYAELWMGTHPSGPSKLSDSDKLLSEYILENDDSLGEEEKKIFGPQLPFLFKALSIAKALSIQAHPNKKHAEELFATRPDVYKDPNHKPEMVIAWLGPFEALCGFRPLTEIRNFLREVKELADIIGKDLIDQLMNAETGLDEIQALQKCYYSLMNSSEKSVASALKQYEQRLRSFDADKKQLLLGELFLRIARDFPGDVGCWSIYFMNYVILQEGESMFLGPNIPHAYIYGDCLECMACSDNVVRAGLTPKFKDIETLCSMLDYQPGTVDRYRTKWNQVDEFCQVCTVPVPDFAMARVRLPASSGPYNIPICSSGSILLILQGKAYFTDLGSFTFGKVIFLKANEQLTVQTQSTEDVIIYQAFSNVK